jgi:hypothetical protein
VTTKQTCRQKFDFQQKLHKGIQLRNQFLRNLFV